MNIRTAILYKKNFTALLEESVSVFPLGLSALTCAHGPSRVDYAHPGLLTLASCAALRASNTCPREYQRT